MLSAFARPANRMPARADAIIQMLVATGASCELQLPDGEKVSLGNQPTTLSWCTNAELGERAVCSSGLPCRHRFPSAMEYVRDEGG
jgi:hypothetical protein